jgi:hypothetical protein
VRRVGNRHPGALVLPAIYARLLPASVPTPPVSAIGFVACGLASIGVGLRVPRVTSILAMVTLSMVVTLAAERAFALGPRVETLVAANPGSRWHAIAPNTAVVLLLAAAALLMRHTHRWFESTACGYRHSPMVQPGGLHGSRGHHRQHRGGIPLQKRAGLGNRRKRPGYCL